jgi:CHAT domain-containing protein
VTEPDAFGLLTTREFCRFVRFGPAREVQAEATRIVTLLDPRQNAALLAAEVVPALRALGRRILDACAAALPEGVVVHTWVIAPDHVLARVPFEALLVRDADPASPPQEWPYLVRDHAVTYVHSATAYVMLADGPADRTGDAVRYVALAHPRYDLAEDELPYVTLARNGDDRFGARRPLPATAQEVAGIAKLLASSVGEQQRLDEVVSRPDTAPDELAGERFALFLRGGASETNLLRRREVKDATILHLACHGSADQAVPSLSHLVLSLVRAANRAPADDGYVFLHELADLGLAVDLLVLSACETHAGNAQQLEGVHSLARAGFGAGANAVLATLWRVPDAVTRDLMVAFYRHWFEGRMSRAQALAHGKREALSRGADLSAWSSFVLWDTGVR